MPTSFRGQVRPTPRQDKSSGSHKAAGLKKPTVSKTCGPSKGSGAGPPLKHPLQTASVLFEIFVNLPDAFRAEVGRSVCKAWRQAADDADAIVAHVRSFGKDGSGPNAEFHGPYASALLPDGRLCVSDSGNQRLVLLSVTGEPRGAVRHRDLEDRLIEPRGVVACVAAEDERAEFALRLYVADREAHRVVRLGLRPDGAENAPRLQFGPDARLSIPQELCLSHVGALLFVTDSSHSVVALQSSTLDFVAQFGGAGGELGCLASPYGLASHDGELFVAEQSAHRISVFRYASHGQGGATEVSFARRFGRKGMAAGQFQKPRGLCCGRSGGGADGEASPWLAVAESTRVQLVTLGGVPLQILLLPSHRGSGESALSRFPSAYQRRLQGRIRWS